MGTIIGEILLAIISGVKAFSAPTRGDLAGVLRNVAERITRGDLIPDAALRDAKFVQGKIDDALKDFPRS